MAMYSRILAAIDDSEPSKLAVQEAIKLTKDQHAKLRIVYIADEFITAGEGVHVDFKEYEKSVREKGKAVLDEMMALARKQNIAVECHLIEIIESSDSISKNIVEEAHKWGADVIVLGTHGRTGISRLLLGSVAEEVVRSTSTPVHLIRSPE